MNRHNQWWTPEEDEYLASNWGRLSRATMAKVLGRTPSSVRLRGHRLGLPRANAAQDFLVVDNVLKAMGYKTHNTRRIFRDAPIKRIVTGEKRKITMIRQDDMMEWLRTHQDEYDASLIDEYALGVEPDWLKQKRREDIRMRRNGIRRHGSRWPQEEIDEAIRLHRRGWTDAKIGALHGRSASAVNSLLKRNGERSERPHKYKRRNENVH